MNKNQMRQGDVWIERVADDQLPEGLEEIKRDHGRVVLAYGELTGHAHAIAERNATLFGKPGTDERWLVIRWRQDQPDGSVASIGSGAVIRHEEHAPIDLSPGVYKVGRQREYSPEAIRNVAD